MVIPLISGHVTISRYNTLVIVKFVPQGMIQGSAWIIPRGLTHHNLSQPHALHVRLSSHYFDKSYLPSNKIKYNKMILHGKIFLTSLLLSSVSAQHLKAAVRDARAVPAKKNSIKYECWASDQSNSVTGQAVPGTNGSFLWIWDSFSIEKQLAGDNLAVPLGCTPQKTTGPCDLLEVFPQDLMQVSEDGAELGTLGGLGNFGRLHGMIGDPLNLYVTANMFTPAGGYVGVISTETKEAIALFRVASTTGSGSNRSVHMSFWSGDGLSIIVDNLHGKMIERIDVERNGKGKITNLKLDQSASLYLGKSFSLLEGSTSFKGKNAFGNELIGEVIGSYDVAGEFTREVWQDEHFRS